MKKVLCISASNIEPARSHSASMRACLEITSLVEEVSPAAAKVQTLSLLDYDLLPCRMCGGCLKTCRCVRDDAFNRVYAQICAADALFFVCPHYAPFPSKVMMLLEKMQEMVFLTGCQDEQFPFPQLGIPVGLVVHGGQKESALPYYREHLLDPLALSFSSCGFDVIGASEEWKNGAAFGIQSLTMPKGEIFCSIEHDWPAIRQRLQPLVQNVVRKMQDHNINE